MQKELIRLNANENFYGCSPKVGPAVKKDVRHIHLYPAAPVKLEEILAEKYNVHATNIVVGGGSVRLIDGIIQTFVAPDEEVITFERSFIAYGQLAAAHRRKCLFVPQNDFVCDSKNILSLLHDKTKVIFIANPNNPTGTIMTHSQLEPLLKRISGETLVVMDEAYGEYVTSPLFPDSLSLRKRFPNLIILRTFSKIYGLAGLRVGYGIMSTALAEKIKANRIPYFFNSLAEDAALAALSDPAFVSACAEKNATERQFLYANLKMAGFMVVPSEGNFLYIHFDSDAEKEVVFKKLLGKGILVCNLDIFGQPDALRIGIGDRKTSLRLLRCL